MRTRHVWMQPCQWYERRYVEKQFIAVRKVAGRSTKLGKTNNNNNNNKSWNKRAHILLRICPGRQRWQLPTHNKDNSKCAPIGPNKRLVLKRASARRCGKSYHKLPHGRPRCVRGRACPVGWWSSWEHTPSKLTTIKWVGPPFAHRRKWTKGVRTFRP